MDMETPLPKAPFDVMLTCYTLFERDGWVVWAAQWVRVGEAAFRLVLDDPRAEVVAPLVGTWVVKVHSNRTHAAPTHCRLPLSQTCAAP